MMTLTNFAGRHEKISEILRQEIRQLRAGVRLESMSALAKRLSVCEPTVRTALLLLAKEGLIEIRHGSGTYVAERVDKRHVGVWLDLDISLPDISYFWRRVSQQVRRGLQAHGYRTRFYPGDFRPGDLPPGGTPNPAPCADLMEDAAEDRLCGLVIVHGTTAPAWREPLRQQQVPCVGWFGDLDASVGVDYEPALREAVRRLLAAGRRKLAFLEWPPTSIGTPYSSDMASGFRDELQRHGVSLNPSWVRNDIHPSLSGAGWGAFREIWTALPDKPDGLVVADDILFRTVVTAIQELGIRVPEQLLVVTHANKGDDYQAPFPVWRMEADPDAQAQALVGKMVALLRRQPLTQQATMLPLQFVAQDFAAENSAGIRETEPVNREGGSFR